MNGAVLGFPIRALCRAFGQAVLSLAATLAPAAAHAGAGFSFDAPRERLVAPGFRLPDLEETPIDLEDYQGKVVLLHFWATFCTPCLEELPALELLWRRYRERGFVIVGIAADRGSAEVVRKFARAAGVTFPVLLDPEGAVRNRYEIIVLPMSYLIGRDGKFSGRIPGSRDWQDPQASALVESLLAKPEP